MGTVICKVHLIFSSDTTQINAQMLIVSLLNEHGEANRMHGINIEEVTTVKMIRCPTVFILYLRAKSHIHFLLW
jgi:hypothetical protein